MHLCEIMLTCWFKMDKDRIKGLPLMFRLLKHQMCWFKGVAGDCFQSKHVLGSLIPTTNIIQAVMQR